MIRRVSHVTFEVVRYVLVWMCSLLRVTFYHFEGFTLVKKAMQGSSVRFDCRYQLSSFDSRNLQASRFQLARKCLQCILKSEIKRISPSGLGYVPSTVESSSDFERSNPLSRFSYFSFFPPSFSFSFLPFSSFFFSSFFRPYLYICIQRGKRFFRYICVTRARTIFYELKKFYYG